MSAPKKPTYVPARYVGPFPARLRPHPPIPGGVYRDGDGKPRTGDKALILHPGDTLMIPETELRGQTYLTDPSGLASDAKHLGAGAVILPEHAAQGLTRDDLIGQRFQHEGALRQYEFHEGRSDFQEVDAPWPPTPPVKESPSGDTPADAAAVDAAVDAAPTRKGKRADAAADAVPSDGSATPAQGA